MKRKMMTLLLAMVLLLNMNICIYAEPDEEYIGDLSRFVTTGTAPKFKDVSQSAWYYNNVNTVALSGLMKGKSATTFDPKLSK